MSADVLFVERAFGTAAVVGFCVAGWCWSMAMRRYRPDVSTYWRISAAGLAFGVMAGAVFLVGRAI